MQLASYLSPKTVVKPSGIVGRGLFAASAIAKGEIVCVKGGHLLDRAGLARHSAVIKAELQIADDLFLAPVSADEFESVMMFLNHSCEPNVGVQGQIVFVALRDIAAGEELTLDDAMIDHDTEPMACRCGAIAWQTGFLAAPPLTLYRVDFSDGTFVGPQSGQTQLAFNTNYELRVRYRDSNGEVSSDAVRTFRTAGETEPVPGAGTWIARQGYVVEAGQPRLRAQPRPGAQGG